MTISEYSKAIDVYHDLLELEPKNLSAIQYLAECHDILGDHKKAELHYSHARKIDPRFPEAYFGSGMILLKRKKFQESRKFFKKAIELDEENPDYWFALAQSYRGQGNYNQAHRAIKKTLEYDPFETDYWLEAAALQKALGNLDESIRILQDSFNFNPEEAEIHYQLGIYYLLNGHNKPGYEHIEQGLLMEFDIHEKVFKPYQGLFNDPGIKNLIEKCRKLLS